MNRKPLAISRRYIRETPAAEFYKLPRTLGMPGKETVIAQDKAFSPALDMLRLGFVGKGSLTRFLGYPALLELAQDGLIRAGVEMLADDCVGKWIELSKQGKEDNDSNGLPDIEEDARRYKVRSLFRLAVANCGYFGGCLVFIDTGDAAEDLADPLVLDGKTFKQGSLKSLILIDPGCVSPGQYNAIDPCAGDYYKPSYWYVQGRPIHESRFLYFAMNDLPPLLKPAYNFFGIPLAQTVLDAVKHFTECREAEARLLTKFSLTVLKTNMDDVLSGGAGEMLDRRVAYMVQNRSNDGVEVIDKEQEDVVNITTPLAGVTDIVRQSMEMVAAYFNEPVTKMWGISPAGFQATGESDMRNHYEHVLATQERIIREPLEKLLRVLQINRSGKIDDAVTFKFVPLGEESRSMVAATQKTVAETDAQYLEMGVISPEEIRQKLVDDPDSGYGGLDPYDLPEKDEEEGWPEGEEKEENIAAETQSASGGEPSSNFTFDGESDIINIEKHDKLTQDAEEENWITLPNGVHVKLDDDGNIAKGPANLTGKNVKDLPEFAEYVKKQKQTKGAAETPTGQAAGAKTSRAELKEQGKYGIINKKTGELVGAQSQPADKKFLTKNGVSKKNGWEFDWNKEISAGYTVEALTDDSGKVQGMLSYTANGGAKNGYFTVQHFETAPKNRHSTGEHKGVLQTLAARVVGESYKRGWSGDFDFTGKMTGKGSQGTLIDYYKKALGARQLSSQNMTVDPHAAKKLWEDWGNG